MVTFQPINQKTLVDATSIYNYYVENSTATFHTEKVTENELAKSLSLGSETYPSYTIHFQKEIVGFCYLSKFRPKQAYDITAEVTLYLHPGHLKKGIGKEVLAFLEKEAKERGIKNLLGVITEENKASIILFEKCGYNKAAHLKNIGIKFNKTLDVTWYQKEI